MVIIISILIYYKKNVKIMVKIDFSKYINSGILSQLEDNNLLYYIVKNVNSTK